MIERLREDNDSDDAIALVIDTFDDMFLEGRFAEADTLMDALEIESYGSDVLVSILSITYPARPHLKRRHEMVTRIAKRLYELCPDRAHELLRERL